MFTSMKVAKITPIFLMHLFVLLLMHRIPANAANNRKPLMCAHVMK